MRYLNLFIFCLILALSLTLTSQVLTQTVSGDAGIVEVTTVNGADVEIMLVDSIDGEAQDELVGTATEPIIIGGWDSLVGEENSLEGIEVEEPSKIPGRFGLWWRGVKEKVSVATTFDPVEKLKKQMKYAAEKMKLAEHMANSENGKVVARAHKVMEKAQNLMDGIDARREKWLSKAGDKQEVLLKNVTALQIRREVALDLLEDKIPEDKLERLKKIREKAQLEGERLINALENQNISDKTKEHLRAVKVRIEAHAEEVKQYRERKNELLQDIKEGDEEAKTKLDEIKQDKKEQLEMIRLQYKENQEALKASAEAGDGGAQIKLQRLEQEKIKVQQRQKVQAGEQGEGVFSPGGFGTVSKQPIKTQVQTEGAWKVEGGEAVSGSGQSEEPPMETVQAEVLPKVEPIKVEPQQKKQGGNF